MIRCSCGSSFANPTSWRQHLDTDKPRDLRARQAHAANHVPTFTRGEHVGTGIVITIRSESHDSEIRERLQRISRAEMALYEELQLLASERERLLRELDPLPTPTISWYKSDIKGTCKTCGARTRWMRGGIYRCVNDVHVEEVVTRRVNGVVSDAVWKILSDEEVDS